MVLGDWHEPCLTGFEVVPIVRASVLDIVSGRAFGFDIYWEIHMRIKTFALALATVAALASGPAAASLSEFQTFVGAGVNVSTDGFGSLGQTGPLTANVPLGSVVLGAYLYSASFGSFATIGDGTTLNGTVVTFGPNVPNATACCGLGSRRADVTSIVKPIIDGGPGGVYNFTVTETAGGQDGEALVVVYRDPANSAVNTVGILDGFASVTGDTTSINFATGLDPNAPGFLAEMRLGIGFSCCGQRSTVRVNGTLITENAGNNDDSGVVANGALFTMGGDDDPFSPLLPSYADDHERYNLTPQITKGDTTISVTTANASQDDNIFLAVFLVSGEAGINEPPPNATVPLPGTLALLGLGMLGLAMSRRRRS